MQLNKTFKTNYNDQTLQIILDTKENDDKQFKDKENYLERLINNEINDQTNLNIDLYTIINLKTIFAKNNIQKLEMKYHNKYLDSDIVYLKGILYSYFYNNKNSNITISYSQDNKLSISPFEIEKYDSVSYLLNDLFNFKNAEAQKLDDDSLKLITIYKLFYKEYPDFSLEITKRKFQNMLYILNQYGLETFINDRPINFLYYHGYMESSELILWLIEMKPFYKGDLKTRKNLINETDQKKILAISNYILNETKDLDQDKFIEELANMIYLKKEWFSRYLNFCKDSNINYPKIIKNLKKEVKK